MTIIDDNNKNDIGRAQPRQVGDNDGGGGTKASEPPGEGALVVDNDDGSDDDFGSGGGQSFDLWFFLSKYEFWAWILGIKVKLL